MFELAIERAHMGDEPKLRVAIRQLEAMAPDVVDTVIEACLLEVPPILWANGWQPAELVRHLRREGGPAVGRLAATLVFADHLGRDRAALHPRWAEQVTQLEEVTVVPFRILEAHGGSWFASWQEAEPLSRTDAIRYAVLVELAMHDVGPLEEVLPPPGASQIRSTRHAYAAHADDPILTKVRALLAQAESTTFPAEAETFTAKAQELMTRHAIDHALLGAGGRGEHPITRRIPVDEPYVDAKSLLLQNVAQHSRCRAVFHQRYALSSVVGFEHDVEAAELLFTSLLVQAQVALTAEAHNKPAGSRPRSRGFRSAFLVAYAVRIGERLAAINDAVIGAVEAETGSSALPVLAARRAEVDGAVDELFGPLRSSTVTSGWDSVGGARGAAAADRARLNLADLAEQSGA